MNNNRVITTILMVTIIIDVMGMGLVFPVLPGLFFDSARAIEFLLNPENKYMTGTGINVTGGIHLDG